jgi:hypothetical protein
MCCGSGAVQSDQQALMAAQTQFTNTLNANYETAFGEQQSALKEVMANANNLIANPTGAPQQTLAQMTTAINENAATAGKQAAGAIAAAAARGGAADVGSGAGGQIASIVEPAIAANKASNLANLSTWNQQVKLAQQQQGREMLSNAAAGFGAAGGTAAGNSAGVAESSTGAGKLALQAGQTGFQDILGGLSAAGAGLETAGSLGAFGSATQQSINQD